MTFPISPFSYTSIDPFTGREVTNTITHVTFYDAAGGDEDEDLWLMRIDAETGEIEMFPDPPE